MNTLRRITSVGLALILLLAVAAPVLAAPGGNSDASAACEDGGYVNWTDSDGNAFRNAGACVRYAAHGGVLSGPFSVAYSNPEPGRLLIAVTGAGLEPSSQVVVTFFRGGFPSSTFFSSADASGNFTLQAFEFCLDFGLRVTSVTATGTPAGGSQTEYSFPPPDASICP